MAMGQWTPTEDPSTLLNPPQTAPPAIPSVKPAPKRKASAPKASSSKTILPSKSMPPPRAPPRHTIIGDLNGDYYPSAGQQAEGSGSSIASGSRTNGLSAYQAAKQKQAEDGEWSDGEDSYGCGFDGDLEIMVNGVPRGQRLAQDSWAVMAQVLQNQPPSSATTLQIRTDAERYYQALVQISKNPGPHQEHPWGDRMHRLLMFYTYVSDVGDKIVCARACNSLGSDFSTRGLRELLGDAEYFETTGSLIRDP
ncbi:hypothetical protein L198_04782 [Cryptococcus wingfieldii CBS 7118]|uniref:Uncharacterized protein n=1 Tax=Cryptococcus wingfieldii CBS 7118 TaxID=1295528 RepID=A0A1E3J1D8_9TREE|nr:hypothetical protein L198_04782 [Cryptococcus wingfieldii CBS 7118]ODN94642.1 hypothetical protein L198_04782 [Cryptococcus wingfieldii CBS 7118]